MASNKLVTMTHDTELCAHESGCDRRAKARDLCAKHWQQSDRDGALPPKFNRHRRGNHTIAADGFCLTCNAPARVSIQLRGDRTCLAARREESTGWTQEAFDLALIAQGNRCSICSQPPNSRGLVGDHNHRTDSTRELLCATCNTGLGMFKDDSAVLRRAAEYLDRTTL